MAADDSERDEEGDRVEPDNGEATEQRQDPQPSNGSTAHEQAQKTDENVGESEEEDTEPQLKYTKLTSNLSSVYRNGDSTSTFLAAGNKLILGTHDGNIHVLSIPTFQSVRVYKAHSASVTAISVSPLRPPLPGAKIEGSITSAAVQARPTTPRSPTKSSSTKATTTQSPKSSPHKIVPATPSNQIYIATASVDGHVCVSSLVDSEDVILRNYARPVQAIALSPDYRADRTYLSGGLAGELILTVGGLRGVNTNANTNSAAAAASGWLGTIGLTANTGKDTILYSGEGSISIINWSLSGRYVVWVDENGVNIMRSHLHVDSSEIDVAWKRINLVERPRRKIWEEMSGVWKARAEWIDDQSIDFMEAMLQPPSAANGHHRTQSSEKAKNTLTQNKRLSLKQPEKLVVGWGDMAWVLKVTPGKSTGDAKSTQSSAGMVEYVNILRFSDCVVSGLSLYTPSLLLVLAYRTHDDSGNLFVATSDGTPRRGRSRQNGQPPELRLVELESQDFETDTLTMSRFESLTTADYHLSTVFVPATQENSLAQRGRLEAFGGGLRDIGANATRLFSAGTSVLSGASSGDKDSVLSPISAARADGIGMPGNETSAILLKPGLKIFVQSPYDCVLATKTDLPDRLSWLLDRENYKEAWELANAHPEAVSPSAQSDSRPSTPSRTGQSLVDFFEDDNTSQVSSSVEKMQNSAVEKEKRRIGNLWMQQLVAAGDWATAGPIASKVLGSSPRWEHWIWEFAHAKKFDEISPHIPTRRLKPPLPSLVYEVVLGHYLVHDKARFRNLLEKWDTNVFSISSVTSTIESRLEDEVKHQDRMILLDALAKLYLEDGRPKDALNCYIRVQNADAALEVIADNNLLDAVTDHIYDFILLRVTPQQFTAADLDELSSLTADPIRLLTDGTRQGVVQADDIIVQLQGREPESLPFLFFYFRSLWNNEGAVATTRVSLRHRYTTGTTSSTTTSPLRTALDVHADLAVSLFAEYSRPLLLPFLKSSTTYSFDHASSICEHKQYIPELVHLLSVTGATKRALYLIIDQLGDIAQAIAFAKECDDRELWDDLLEYSMDTPALIRTLLEEVGTSEGVDAVQLVRRIPEGLVIQGLKEGLSRILRDFECQWSIAEGVARVLRTEVAGAYDELNAGRKRGLVFNVLEHYEPKMEHNTSDREPREGCCGACSEAYNDTEDDFLIGFPCHHIFHLTCLLDAITDDGNKDAVNNLQKQLQLSLFDRSGDEGFPYRSVSTKVVQAQLISTILGDRGCLICRGERPV